MIGKTQATHNHWSLALIVPELSFPKLNINSLLGPLTLRFLEGIRSHSLLVEIVIFDKIDEIELYLLFWSDIADLKEEPVCMAFGVAIHSHHQIVLRWIHVDS